MDSSRTSRRLCAIALADLDLAATPLPRPARGEALAPPTVRLSKIQNLLLLLGTFLGEAGGAILQPQPTNEMQL